MIMPRQFACQSEWWILFFQPVRIPISLQLGRWWDRRFRHFVYVSIWNALKEQAIVDEWIWALWSGHH